MRKYILIFLILIGGISFYFWGETNQTNLIKDEEIVEVAKPIAPSVSINNLEIPVEVMRTDEEVRKGLSGRESLDAKNGMLFIFSEANYYRFWMPDMYFPIDIIWINNNNNIVDISHNISNEFDPKNPKFYSPSKKANYVLEVNAGFSKKNNIKIGDSIVLNNVK